MRFTCKLNWWALVVCLELLGASARVAPSTAAGLPPAEERRRRELQDRLCAVKRLNCPYIIEVLADPRLIIYYPPKRDERRARLAEALSLQHIQPVSVFVHFRRDTTMRSIEVQLSELTGRVREHLTRKTGKIRIALDSKR